MKPFFLAALAALPFIVAAACGGSVASTGDGSGGGNGNDAGGGGGGSGSGCPATMPTSGTCSPNGLVCEYGTSNGRCNNPFIDCENGKWTVPPTVPQPFCQAPSTGCPASKSDVAVGEACGDTDMDCEYPDGRCACSMQQGGPVQINPDGGEIPREWRCEIPQEGCPSERPRVGSSCSQIGKNCDYGACVIPDGVQIACSTAGRWEFSDFGCAD